MNVALFNIGCCHCRHLILHNLLDNLLSFSSIVKLGGHVDISNHTVQYKPYVDM